MLKFDISSLVNSLKQINEKVMVVERVFEKRMRKIDEMKQYGFVAGKGTTDTIFRQLQ